MNNKLELGKPLPSSFQATSPVIASEVRQSMPKEDDAVSLPDLLQVVAGWHAY